MCVPKPWERMWKHQHESMYSFSNKGGIQFGPFLEKGICEDMHKCEAKLAPVRLFQLTLESLKRDGPPIFFIWAPFSLQYFANSKLIYHRTF